MAGLRRRIGSGFAHAFAAGAVASAVWVAWRVAELAASVGIGRLADFGLLFEASRRAKSAGLLRVEHISWIAWAYEPHALSSGAEVAGFGARALGFHLVGVALLAALAAPIVGLLLARRRKPLRRPLVSLAVAGALVGGVLLVALGAASLDTRPDVPEPRPPNVLFVSIDTLRADHLHAYGYPRETSPNLDRLAAEGARFEQAVSPSPWTLPTHVTMLTGLPPAAHGVNQPRGLRLDPDVVSLPEVLRDHGYATAAFVAGGYLDAEYGHLQGFDLYDDYSVPQLCRKARQGYRDCVTSPLSLGAVSRYLEGWDAAGRDRPFFVFLHLWDVHNDYVPPAPYDTLFAPEGALDFTVGTIMDGEVDAAALTEAQREHLIGLYDGEIRLVDDAIGQVVDQLETLSALDETLIVVVADHGEELGDHGRWGHHETLYEESVRVPLILRLPGTIPPGTVVSAQAKLADIPLTLLSLLGIRSREPFGAGDAATRGDARDLTPLLTGDGADWVPSPAFGNLHGRLASVRTQRWKYVEDTEHPGGGRLFDLVGDPEERSDVAARHPEVVAALSRQLAAWRARWDEADPRQGEALEQSEEQLEQLRALGYVD